ncbi:hypothetical protein FACS189485_08570 [Spirochaetia bacterium]|nr:hypothetical protein FACS189485_08570 [Spirochaetia bacterium]
MRRGGYGVRSRDPIVRYHDLVRHEQKALEDFVSYEAEWADDVLTWYRIHKLDIPDDVYRAAAFFRNREFTRKPEALWLLYVEREKWNKELPLTTEEMKFDLVADRYKRYARILEMGGFD